MNGEWLSKQLVYSRCHYTAIVGYLYLKLQLWLSGCCCCTTALAAAAARLLFSSSCSFLALSNRIRCRAAAPWSAPALHAAKGSHDCLAGPNGPGCCGSVARGRRVRFGSPRRAGQSAPGHLRRGRGEPKQSQPLHHSSTPCAAQMI